VLYTGTNSIIFQKGGVMRRVRSMEEISFLSRVNSHMREPKEFIGHGTRLGLHHQCSDCRKAAML
jgi:hypothetical protein